MYLFTMYFNRKVNYQDHNYDEQDDDQDYQFHR